MVVAVSDFLNSGDAKGKWIVVPGESTVTFENKTLWGMSTVSGRFTKFSGHGQVTEAGDVSGELDIEVSSVDTGSRMRDRHLRSDNFFKVTRFPQIKVVVTGADPVSADAVGLQAFITVTGTTRPLPLRAVVSPRDDDSVTVSGGQTIDHEDLGIRWNKLRVISKHTAIHADLVFRRVESTPR